MSNEENGQYQFHFDDLSEDEKNKLYLQQSKKMYEDALEIIGVGGAFGIDDVHHTLSMAQMYIGWLTEYLVPTMEEQLDTLQRYGGDNA